MIIHDVKQGSAEWKALRIGRPTASEFHHIVTPGGKASASAPKYMGRLIAEIALNESQARDLDGIPEIDNGKLLEPRAVALFEFEHDIETRKVGFITTDSGRWGASPDRMFDGGVIEVKCPTPAIHCLYAIEDFGTAYKVQTQGQLLVAEADILVRYSHCPPFKPVENRGGRDKPFIVTLDGELQRFSDTMERHIERLRAVGFFAEIAARPPDERDIDDVIASYGAHHVTAA